MANLNNLKHDMVATINNHEVIELITKSKAPILKFPAYGKQKKKSASVTAKKGIFFFLTIEQFVVWTWLPYVKFAKNSIGKTLCRPL